jgi:hypothetical protein
MYLLYEQLECLKAVGSIREKWVSIVVHGAGRDLTVAGPVRCWDCLKKIE